MKSMLYVLVLLSISQNIWADEHNHSHGEKGQGLRDACKVECPTAKTEHEAHECMKKLVKKDKQKKLFGTDCFKALKEHEAEEKKHGHKH